MNSGSFLYSKLRDLHWENSKQTACSFAYNVSIIQNIQINCDKQKGKLFQQIKQMLLQFDFCRQEWYMAREKAQKLKNTIELTELFFTTRLWQEGAIWQQGALPNDCFY